ncbi:DEAD/DEAH box helicase family protein [Holophaga foetida]|uniref:DEAD/DEAH box helicase family protein n=1 Tax=Holophaga foetida TaxID=35839 RepID=UPI0002474668|nr:DEAD/DEAH box helicase family protein [Holophaga foetida]
MTHFAFLQPEWPQIAASALKAESLAMGDPRTACFYARRTLELMVTWLYEHDGSLRKPYQEHLSALIYEPSFQSLLEARLVAKAKLIKDLGNMAVHSTKPVRVEDSVAAVRDLFHLGFWLARTYARKQRPSEDLVFRAGELPPPVADATVRSLTQLQRLNQELEAKDEALAASRKAKAEVDEELVRLQAEIAQIKAQNQALPDTHDYSEAATRATIIDLLLKEAGWPLDQARDREFEIRPFPNASGVGYADYVLWGSDGKPLGVVEAKRSSKSPQEGKQQAKLYADGLEQMFGQRPLIFYTNGYKHWIWDDALYPPRELQGFLTRSELELAIQRRSSRKPLGEAEIDTTIVGRSYQLRAIRRIGETFEKDNQRKALVVMATGAGKTRTVIALCDLLMRCNWAKRILFLADRVALVNQAVNAFKKFLPENNPVNLVTDKGTEGRIYVSTYPTLMGLIDEVSEGQRRFGPGHFDLIIIDEAHRSVYQRYRAIFRYFDSYLVGLTATPRDEVDRDTYGLFDLEKGVPTDVYELDEAIRDGHLVEYRSREVPLKFHREGIQYDQLPEEEQAEWDALDWEDGEVPDAVPGSALHNWLFNADTVDKVLGHVMKHGLKVEGGDRLGKTIVFARNHDHAEFIVERFDTLFPHLKGHFARVIDFKVNYAQTLIDDFSKLNQAPHIAVSVDMLDTGIDVPEVLNLVFFKPVRSRTKFWQMIGRGTRLCPDLFGPGRDKSHFLIFDFFENFEFFRQNPNPKPSPLPESLGQQVFRARTELVLGLDRALGERACEVGDEDHWTLRDETAQRLHQHVTALNPDSFLVRPHLELVEHFAKPEAWTATSVLERPEAVGILGGLPTGIDEGGEEARRFDLLALKLQLALLRKDTDWERLQNQLVSIANALSQKGTIPMVAAHMELVHDIASDLWWEGLTLPLLESARLKLRELVKFIDRVDRKVLYTDFEDELGEESISEPLYVPMGVNMERFRAKARQFLLAHGNHLTIHRLRMNEPLTPMDLGELERMLREAGLGNEAELEKAKQESHGLGLFVRSLIGLDRAAAKTAFAEFLQGSTLNGDQIDFLEMVIDHLTEHGAMEPSLLYESPYTDINHMGVEGVFNPPQVEVLLGVLAEVRRRAVA